MIRRYGSAILAAPTLVALVLVAAYAIFYVNAFGGARGINAWDSLFPTLTETSTIAQIGLLWWLFFLIPLVRRLGRVEVMTRYGSWIRVVADGCREMCGVLLAGVTVLTALSIVVSLPLRWSFQWSAQTASLAASSQPLPAFTAANLARYFPNPLLALIVCAIFSAFAFLAIAFCALALGTRFGPTLAIWLLSLFYFWAVLCSFGVSDAAPALDVSNILSLAWAFSTNGVTISVFVLVAVVLLGILSLVRTARAGPLRFVVTNRPAVFAALMVLVALTSYSASRGAGTMSAYLGVYFAGSYGSLVQYVVASCVGLVWATAYAGRLEASAGSLLFYEALREGSYVRWVAKSLRNETVRAFFLAVASMVVVVGVFSLIHGTRWVDSSDNWRTLAMIALGVFLETVLLCCVAMGLLWLRGALTAWPIVVAAVLVLGYPILGNLGSLNLFAPFSIPDGGGRLSLPSSGALVITFVIALLASGVSLFTASRRTGQLVNT